MKKWRNLASHVKTQTISRVYRCCCNFEGPEFRVFSPHKPKLIGGILHLSLPGLARFGIAGVPWMTSSSSPLHLWPSACTHVRTTPPCEPKHDFAGTSQMALPRVTIEIVLVLVLHSGLRRVSCMLDDDDLQKQCCFFAGENS